MGQAKSKFFNLSCTIPSSPSRQSSPAAPAALVDRADRVALVARVAKVAWRDVHGLEVSGSFQIRLPIVGYRERPRQPYYIKENGLEDRLFEFWRQQSISVKYKYE